MTSRNLEYQLVDGYIHNWLVAGPVVSPSGEGWPGGAPDLSEAPVERGKFHPGGDGGPEWTWRYLRCMDDHLADLPAFSPLPGDLSAWAFTVLKLPAAYQVTFELFTSGFAEVWLNGVQVYRAGTAGSPAPTTALVIVDLKEGENQVLVRFGRAGMGACPVTMALKLAGLPEAVEKAVVVQVPTLARFPRRHETLEEAFDRAYLEEVVNHRGAHINLHWAEGKGPKMKYAYQVQDREGFVYVEGSWETDPEKPLDVGHGFRLREQPYFVTLRPVILEYFEHNLRYEKRLPIYVTDHAYASLPTAAFPERQREALEDAAKHSGNLYAAIASLALGRWDDFKPDLVMAHIQSVNRREVGSNITLLGLLGMMYRYQDDPKFPEALRQPLEDCVLNFRYGQDEDSLAPHAAEGLIFDTESDSLISHACQALAGQLFPRRTFTGSAETGQQQRLEGERLAFDWLRRRGTQGFQSWDSNDAFEKHFLALSHLASLAEDLHLRELAAVMMDKTFFSMAVNSYKGAFGSTHGSTSASMLKSAQLEATSGISRMMWGTGVYNAHILGTVSLATSSYEFPLLLGDIANDTASTVWNRERHVVDPTQGLEVNKVTYRTPDFMLSSAQDYRPGEMGQAEHIWQATLGPDAVVFVNHPARFSDAEGHRPGFWLGNRSLPRAAQWKDLLVAVYHLPEDDRMGFTHAYFPVFQFSEHEIMTEKGHTWAFARKEDGYLALTSSQGFELVRRAPDGYRELRSYAHNNIWLCQMGRAETDGSFDRFKQRVLSQKLDFQGLEVHCKTLRGDYVSFGWEGPLTVNGNEKPLHGYPHYESPYCRVDLPAQQMDIQANGTLMRLDFS